MLELVEIQEAIKILSKLEISYFQNYKVKSKIESNFNATKLQAQATHQIARLEMRAKQVKSRKKD